MGPEQEIVMQNNPLKQKLTGKMHFICVYKDINSHWFSQP